MCACTTTLMPPLLLCLGLPSKFLSREFDTSPFVVPRVVENGPNRHKGLSISTQEDHQFWKGLRFSQVYRASSCGLLSVVLQQTWFDSRRFLWMSPNLPDKHGHSWPRIQIDFTKILKTWLFSKFSNSHFQNFEKIDLIILANRSNRSNRKKSQNWLDRFIGQRINS